MSQNPELAFGGIVTKKPSFLSRLTTMAHCWLFIDDRDFFEALHTNHGKSTMGIFTV